MRGPVREPASPWGFVGIAVLVATGWLYGATVFVVPWWAGVLLVVAWLAFFVQGCRWFVSRPRAVAVLAAAAVLVWYVGVQLGETYVW